MRGLQLARKRMSLCRYWFEKASDGKLSLVCPVHRLEFRRVP
jgi:hypothetical protein